MSPSKNEREIFHSPPPEQIRHVLSDVNRGTENPPPKPYRRKSSGNSRSMESNVFTCKLQFPKQITPQKDEKAQLAMKVPNLHLLGVQPLSDSKVHSERASLASIDSERRNYILQSVRKGKFIVRRKKLFDFRFKLKMPKITLRKEASDKCIQCHGSGWVARYNMPCSDCTEAPRFEKPKSGIEVLDCQTERL